MQGDLRALAPPRREEALAFIVERIARSGTSPSYEEIGRSLNPPVGRTRARQLVDQLVALRVIDRDPGSQRGIRIRDLAQCRQMIEDELAARGWWHAKPMGALESPTPCTNEQLPLMPAFEHLPDVVFPEIP